MWKCFLFRNSKIKLIHSNVVDNSYQQNSRVLYTFVPNKSFGQLLYISQENFIFLEIFDSEFFYIEVWFTDQNSNHVEIEDKIKINLVVNWSITHKIWHAIQFNQEIELL